MQTGECKTWLVTRAPQSVWCVVCAFLPTDNLLALNRVAREWRHLVPTAAALLPCLVIPARAQACPKWAVDRLCKYRPRRLKIEYALTRCDLRELAAIRPISYLDIRVPIELSLTPLLRLEHLATLRLTLYDYDYYYISILPASGITALSIDIGARSGQPRIHNAMAMALSVVAGDLPRQLTSLASSSVLCKPTMWPLGEWPPQLARISAFQFDFSTLPQTLTHVTLKRVTDGQLAAIFGLPRLLHLDLSHSDLASAAPLTTTARCGLESLRLAFANLRDESLAAICRCIGPALRDLDLERNLLMHDLSPLSAFTRLETLRLPGYLTNTTFAHLSSTCLTRLNMGRAYMSDDFGLLLRHCPRSLRHVELPMMTQCKTDSGHIICPITALADIGRVLEALPNLAIVDMSAVELSPTRESARHLVRQQIGARLATMVPDHHLPTQGGCSHADHQLSAAPDSALPNRATGDSGKPSFIGDRAIRTDARIARRGISWSIALLLLAVLLLWCAW